MAFEKRTPIHHPSSICTIKKFTILIVIVYTSLQTLKYTRLLQEDNDDADEFDKPSLIFPVSFGLPDDRFSRAKDWKNNSKTRDFAHLDPGNEKTFTYSSVESYYNGYAESFFGLTFKKSGWDCIQADWDCLRHYDIIASGSMPYFLDHEQLPATTMVDYPLSIVKQAMHLDGVPTQEEYRKHIQDGGSMDDLKIDHSIFDRDEYDRLMEDMTLYSIDRLSWTGKGKDMVSQLKKLYPCLPKHPKILMVMVPRCESQSCMFFGAFHSLVGSKKFSTLFGPKFNSTAPIDGDSAYETFIDRMKEQQALIGITKERFDEGFFEMIIFLNGGTQKCNLHEFDLVHELKEYQEKHNPLIVAVDQNDEDGCHVFFEEDEEKLTYHAHFAHEYVKASPSDLLVPWTGCLTEEDA